MINAIDLCCGAGGWAFAARGLPIRFVAVADLAPDCLETWRINHEVNHPECALVEADLSTADGIGQVVSACGARQAGVDLVLGGIPCEQVSIMRQSPADAETMAAWHDLLDGCLGLVDQFAPRWWAIEDVIQIERHLPLPLWHGSEVPAWRCNAADFGPQDRTRTYLGRFPRPAARRLAERSLGECLRPGPHLTIPGQESYERLSYPGRKITLRAADKTARVLSVDRPSPTVLGRGPTSGQRQRRNWCVEDERGRLRILCLQEFARLQGFPDDALFAGGATRAQKMVGQAIPIYVGRAILQEICAAASLTTDD